MALLSDADRRVAEAICDLCYENPFLPGRRALERRALGDAYVEAGDAWGLGSAAENPNIEALAKRTSGLLARAQAALREGHVRSDADTAVYQGLVRYYLFDRLGDLLSKLSAAYGSGDLGKRRVSSFKLFTQETERLCSVPGAPLPLAEHPAHLFATLFQVRRAFDLVRDHILGTSKAAQALRGAVWQSIFSHDMRRYERSLYRHIHGIPTLITGPSGTGKELVARAIGKGHYIPFDVEALRFSQADCADFHGLNIAALSPTLLESELFGHRRGAFSGAVEDRTGWLERCGSHGSVFLDEIGELSPAVQVKLLRVLQSRQLSRVGESELRPFEGKLITATNRDLAADMGNGSFRQDLYYRLCADSIETPSLGLQLRQAPEDLAHFVRHMASRVVDAEDLEPVTSQVVDFVQAELGVAYSWPGNIRELEQCVRAVVIRGRYRPARPATAETGRAVDGLAGRFARGELSADALLDAYCTLMYHYTGSYQEAARRLGMDRRTVRARRDEALLATLQADGVVAPQAKPGSQAKPAPQDSPPDAASEHPSVQG